MPFRRFFTSTHQKNSANANKAHPPEANTKETVLIRLIIGVIPVKSNPYPITNPANPAKIKVLIFSEAGLAESNKLPQMAPKWYVQLLGSH